MIEDVGGIYHEWLNPYDDKSFDIQGNRSHPQPMTGRPKPDQNTWATDRVYWDQQTYVDVESLSKVLDVAMAAAGAKRRGNHAQ